MTTDLMEALDRESAEAIEALADAEMDMEEAHAAYVAARHAVDEALAQVGRYERVRAILLGEDEERPIDAPERDEQVDATPEPEQVEATATPGVPLPIDAPPTSLAIVEGLWIADVFWCVARTGDHYQVVSLTRDGHQVDAFYPVDTLDEARDMMPDRATRAPRQATTPRAPTMPRTRVSISPGDADVIRWEASRGVRHRDLAARFNVSRQSIGNVVNRHGRYA